MSQVHVTKGIEFAAAHRYVREEWDDDTNRARFGSCFNEPGHGHNYFLRVTVSGDVDAQTGMVVNLYDLKVVLKQVLAEFDHKHLNLDTPYFKDIVPTTENIARVLWRLIESHRSIGRLETVELTEDEDLFATIRAARGVEEPSIARRYAVWIDSTMPPPIGRPYARRGEYELWVTVRGPIDPTTGMVIDLRQLDRVMHEQVLTSIPGVECQLGRTERTGSGEELARTVWLLLTPHLGGVHLEHVKLIESRDLAYEYNG